MTPSTIARIEAFPVRYPEPNNDGKIRALTLVRVEADDGQTGWGEAITGGQETSLAVGLRRRAAAGAPAHRRGPDGRRRTLAADARRDLLGRQRRHRDVRHLGARHGALGSQGPASRDGR